MVPPGAEISQPRSLGPPVERAQGSLRVSKGLQVYLLKEEGKRKIGFIRVGQPGPREARGSPEGVE
jgi:hypothetical protein